MITFPYFGSYMPPIFGYRLPTTNALQQNAENMQGTRCEQFELNFYRCCEAFGLVASRRQCDLEYRDLLECMYNRKQSGRVYAMRKERMNQFLEGKLPRPWTTTPPTMLEAKPDWYQFNDVNSFNTW